MPILQRAAATQAAQPGQPIKRENDYIRHGTRVALASFVVTTGQVLYDLRQTRGNVDFCNHLQNTAFWPFARVLVRRSYREISAGRPRLL